MRHRALPPTAAVPQNRPWLTLLTVSSGLFLAVVSTTVVSVALPAIGHQLAASATQLEWVVDAYVVIYACLLVPGGALGDRHGRKGLFLIGVALFGVGSSVSGLAPSMGVLLIARIIQGAGAALLTPGSLTIIRAVFEDPRRRAMAIGVWSTSSGVALAVGPPVGGVLVAAWGWRSVFLAVTPLAAVLLIVGAWVLPRLPAGPVRMRFDGTAAVLITAAVALLAVGVIEGQAAGWSTGWVPAAFAAGTAAMVGFVIAERCRPDPLVDVSLFARPAFAVANAAAFLLFFAFVGALVYFSAFFQQVQDRSPIATGLAVAPIGLAYAIAATASGRVVARIGERGPLVIGLVVSGGAMLGLLRLTPAVGLDAIWWNFALLGAGIGLCGTPMSTIAMSAVDATRAGQASAVLNAARQIGQVFGVAVLGALVYADLPGVSGTGARLDAHARELFVLGLHRALWLAGSALLIAAVLAFVLVRRQRTIAVSP